MGARTNGNGLTWKKWRAFRHREQIAGEAEAPQIFPEARRDAFELRQASQIVDLLACEPQFEQDIRLPAEDRRRSGNRDSQVSGE